MITTLRLTFFFLDIITVVIVKKEMTMPKIMDFFKDKLKGLFKSREQKEAEERAAQKQKEAEERALQAKRDNKAYELFYKLLKTGMMPSIVDELQELGYSIESLYEVLRRKNGGYIDNLPLPARRAIEQYCSDIELYKQMNNQGAKYKQKKQELQKTADSLFRKRVAAYRNIIEKSSDRKTMAARLIAHGVPVDISYNYASAMISENGERKSKFDYFVFDEEKPDVNQSYVYRLAKIIDYERSRLDASNKNIRDGWDKETFKQRDEEALKNNDVLMALYFATVWYINVIRNKTRKAEQTVDALARAKMDRRR